MIPKRENEIKADFFTVFNKLFSRRQYFVVQHQDVRKSGYPDSVIHGYGHATSWEFKHCTPNFDSQEIQELTCHRIACRSYCRYVLFYERFDEQRIVIAHPKDVFGRDGKFARIVPEHSWDGFDFNALATHIHSVHTAYDLR